MSIRFVMLWGIELKLGMVVGDGPMRCMCGHIFEATPPGVKGLAGVNLPKKLPYAMATKFVEKSPWPECTALLGSKVMQVSSGDNHLSSCLEMPYGHQICWEESLTSVMYCCNQFCNIKWHLWTKICSQIIVFLKLILCTRYALCTLV